MTLGWKHETRKVSELKEWAKNPRRLTDKGIARLKESLEKFGVAEPIVINQDNVICGGHGRLKALKQLGIKEVPVYVATLDDKQFEELNIRLNKNIAGEWDFDILANEFEQQELLDWGFEPEEFGIKEVLNEGLTDEDAVPEAPVEPVTKLGDIWLLGNHRLMCGDSTSIDAVEKLMGGQKPNTMVTDPPYGVNLDQSWRDKALGSKALGKGNSLLVENDDKADWTDVWSIFEGNIAYVWHASSFTDVVMDSLRKAGLEPSQQIIWNKSVMVMGRSDYHFKHEPCWYAVRKGKNHNWKGDRKQTTIWDAAPPNHIMGGSKEEKTSHPTQKPARLYEIAYLNHTNPGEYVYEPFGGSGTSIIVCEKLGLRSLSMELDPKYCDVIIKRWQEFTGKEATLEGTDNTYNSLTPNVKQNVA